MADKDRRKILNLAPNVFINTPRNSPDKGKSPADKRMNFVMLEPARRDRPKNMAYEKWNKKAFCSISTLPVYAIEMDLPNTADRHFVVGEVAKGKKGQYTVKQILGPRTYVVQLKGSNEEFVMKTEASLLAPDGPILRRELLFWSSLKRPPSLRNSIYFMKFADCTESKGDPSYSAVFMNKCMCGLDTMRQKILEGAEFSKQTALLLCMVTLKAIHDVHLNDYVHRDIRLKNFMVSEDGSEIYITGLAYSFDRQNRDTRAGVISYKKLAKLPSLSRIFQSRSWHKYESITEFWHDVECWLYMCYDLFNSKALPWAQGTLSERDYLSMKEGFFVGVYDSHFDSVGIPPLMHAIRRYLYNAFDRCAVDYAFIAHVLRQIAGELNLKWGVPYEWQGKKLPVGVEVIDGSGSKSTPLGTPKELNELLKGNDLKVGNRLKKNTTQKKTQISEEDEPETVEDTSKKEKTPKKVGTISVDQDEEKEKPKKLNQANKRPISADPNKPRASTPKDKKSSRQQPERVENKRKEMIVEQPKKASVPEKAPEQKTVESANSQSPDETKKPSSSD